MSGALQSSDGESGARCVHCGAEAAGPCATCRRPVCGDCCTLTEGGVQVWAICLSCDQRNGRSLSAAWRGLVYWLIGILGVMALVVWLLSRFG